MKTIKQIKKKMQRPNTSPAYMKRLIKYVNDAIKKVGSR